MGTAAHRILVVEDEAVIAADIRMSLGELGFEVVGSVQNGRAALAAVARDRPDLVLMDIRIQGEMDGIDTALRIQDSRATPIIFLTSFSDEPTLARAKHAGAYGYLLKPFTDRDLKVAIDVAISKAELEQKLAERTRWFETTLRSIGDAVIATDARQRISFMNSVAEKLTGWTQKEAEGHALDEVFRLVEPESGRPMEGPLSRALSGGFTVELPSGTLLANRQGDKREVDDSAAPIVTDMGRVLGGVVVFRDVTERRDLEKRLAQSERLAAIGTLSAGMAHEINNPLAYVLANVEFALDALPRLRSQLLATQRADCVEVAHELAELVEALDEARQGSQRVHRVVHELKRFGRVEKGADALVELTEVIETAVRMTENVVRHHAHVRLELQTTPFIEGDPGQLGQVFINLLVNAAQAIGEGDADTKEIVITSTTDDRGHAVVEVRDSGPGIPPALVTRIFDPFFTTKAVGEGSGLGLSISRSLVRAHGGDLVVESEPGRGATFRVTLPAARDGDVDAERADGPSVAVATRRGRILILDDEPAIGRAVSRILRREHEVFISTDPRDVLPRIRSGETFDVIICDLMMPTMTGMDFYDAVCEANAELGRRIIFMTGGSFTPRADEFLRETSNATVSKPADPRALRRLVGDYVGAAAEPAGN